MINPFLTFKKPFSVNFTYPADTGRVVDRVLCVQQSPVSCILCSVFFLPRPAPAALFSNTSLNQVNQFAQFAQSTKNNLIMQNKPNLCPFYPLNADSYKKQTQSNPIQTQNKAIFTPKNRPQSQNKPNSNPIQTQNLPAIALAKADSKRTKNLAYSQIAAIIIEFIDYEPKIGDFLCVINAVVVMPLKNVPSKKE
jgi:hypothetical protein